MCATARVSVRAYVHVCVCTCINQYSVMYVWQGYALNYKASIWALITFISSSVYPPTLPCLPVFYILTLASLIASFCLPLHSLSFSTFQSASFFHLPPSSPLFTPLSSSPPALLPLFISSSFPSAILILFIFLFHPPFRHHLCSTHFLFLNACSIHFSSCSSSLSLYFFHIPLSLSLFHLPSFLHILIYLFFSHLSILIYLSIFTYSILPILYSFALPPLFSQAPPPPPQFTPPYPPITGVLNIGSSSLEEGG